MISQFVSMQNETNKKMYQKMKNQNVELQLIYYSENDGIEKRGLPEFLSRRSYKFKRLEKKMIEYAQRNSDIVTFYFSYDEQIEVVFYIEDNECLVFVKVETPVAHYVGRERIR